MNTSHFEFWPRGLAKTLSVPQTTIFDNLLVSARRYPEKTAIYYYGNAISYQQLLQEVEQMAGFMQKKIGVAEGDRVLLFMQNSPQFVIAYYAILRVQAIVVPINPMNLTHELAFYVEDAGAKVAFASQELYPRLAPLLEEKALQQAVVAAYSEYANADFDLEMPIEVRTPPAPIENSGVISWREALAAAEVPLSKEGIASDIAVLPYTSGTTGRPKGCIHTHATVQANLAGAAFWNGLTPDSVALATLPLFHVTGMVHSMHAPLFSGSAMVLMTRWNREVATALIERHRCSHWINISTMVVDFLANPHLQREQIASLHGIGGGGATLPEAVGEKLFEMTGIRYAEGYGLSETISQTHFNPPDRPKMQCLGIPSFDVDARVVDPETLRELGPQEEGELLIHGPQVFKGYWNRPGENAFVLLAGKSFLRTGDIVKYDEEGYFFIVDRVKRMINASGFKVWPTEVESILYKHPAVKEACVIGVPDERRGETVKAFLVLHESAQSQTTEADIIEWAKERMASYKYPRFVEFVEQLPISGSGKILWRQLQEQERAKRQQLPQ